MSRVSKVDMLDVKAVPNGEGNFDAWPGEPTRTYITSRVQALPSLKSSRHDDLSGSRAPVQQ